ncbi:MAG: hypothetical protein ACT4P9_08850 [Betaproteobacteria bacterium]
MRGGQNLGTDTIEIRANDGFGWSDWDSFDLVTRLPNRAPVVSVQDFATGVGQEMSVTRLFSVSDTDGDAIQTYRFWDGGTGGGVFRVNGIAQPFRQNIDVVAGDLANTVYVGGNQFGSENLSVQVFDGAAWSDWKTFSMSTATLVRFPEFVHTRNADAIFGSQDGVYYGLGGNDSMGGASFTATFLVGGTGNDAYNVGNPSNFSYVLESGNSNHDQLNFGSFNFNSLSSFTGLVDGRHLVLGSWYGGDSFGLTMVFDWERPADRIEFYNIGNGSYSYDEFRTRVLASDPETFTYADLGVDGGVLNEEIAYYRDRSASLDVPNLGPVVTSSGYIPVEGRVVYANQLFSASDPEGDSIVSYEFTDVGVGGGMLRIGGVAQASGVPVVVLGGNLPDVSYLAGGAGSSDALRVRASDGGTFGAATNIDISPVANSAPVLHPSSTSVDLLGAATAEGTGSTKMLASLFGATNDADGDAVFQWEVTDLGEGGGYLTVGTGGPRTALTPILLDQIPFQTVGYHAGTADGTELVRVRAFDGTAWSEPVTIDFRTITNLRPVPGAGGSTTVTPGETVRLSTLYSTATDPDGGSISMYQLELPAAAPLYPFGGYLSYLGGGQSVLTGLHGEAGSAYLSYLPQNLTAGVYAGAAGDYVVSLRAYDGIDWSDWRDATIHVVAPADTAGNTGASARALTASTTPQTIHEWIGAADDPVDYYRVTLTQPTYLDVRLSNPTATGYRLRFQNADGSELNGGATYDVNWFDAPRTTSLALTTGDYLVAVSPLGDTAGYYDLEFSTHVGPPPDFAGNGNNFARMITVDAAPRTYNDWVGVESGFAVDNADTYRFTLANPGTVHVVISGNTQPIWHVSPTMVNSGGGVQLWPGVNIAYPVPTGGIALDLTAPSAGDYALQLVKGDGPGTYYDLTVSLSFAPNAAPVTSGASLAVASLTTVRMSSLFSALDADGDSVLKVQVEVPGTTPISAFTTGTETLEFDGSAWTLPSFGNLAIDVGAHGSVHVLSARAFDGMAWGDWQEITVTSQAGAPALDIAGNSPSAAAPVQLGNLVLADAIGGADAADYFIFTVGSGQALDLDLDGITAGGSVQFAIYQNSGGTLGALAAGTSPLVIDDDGFDGTISLAGGTYYGELVPLSGTETPYNLTFGPG